MNDSQIRFGWFPRTEAPPEFTHLIADVFRQNEHKIATGESGKHLTSDEVLGIVRPGLEAVGFQVESGKRKDQKIARPVFFGENGEPTLRFEVDAYHEVWKCGLEVEAIRAIRGGAVFRDLIQALVMDQVNNLCIAVPNLVTWGKEGKNKSRCYRETIATAEALFGHSRINFPYRLMILGY